jgi:hypothetical protein
MTIKTTPIYVKVGNKYQEIIHCTEYVKNIGTSLGAIKQKRIRGVLKQPEFFLKKGYYFFKEEDK